MRYHVFPGRFGWLRMDARSAGVMMAGRGCIVTLEKGNSATTMINAVWPERSKLRSLNVEVHRIWSSFQMRPSFTGVQLEGKELLLP